MLPFLLVRFVRRGHFDFSAFGNVLMLFGGQHGLGCRAAATPAQDSLRFGRNRESRAT
jgi:hypothetical protein